MRNHKYKKVTKYSTVGKSKFQILEHYNMYIGKKMWVIHSKYNTKAERDEAFDELQGVHI